MAVVGVVCASATADAPPNVINGTPGVVNGTPGDDAIYAGAGVETINAGAGNDVIYPGSGTVTVNGGPGIDAVVYTGTTPVRVTLDGKANDGPAGADQNIEPDVEDIYGGDGDDTLIGNNADNTIDGGPGNDTIFGGGGNNALYGGPGNDVINARNGKQDVIDCGPGDDTVITDPPGVDIIAKDCEHIVYPGETVPPGVTIAKPHFIVHSIANGSSLIVTCISGCKPATSPAKPILSVKSVHPNAQDVATFALPPQIQVGATIEVGAKAPRSVASCVRYKVVSGLPALKTKCTSVARLG